MRSLFLNFHPIVAKFEDLQGWDGILDNSLLHKLYLVDGAEVKDVNIDVKTLNCAAFAFLYLQETDFNFKKDPDVSEIEKNHFEFLSNLNYRLVALPNTGDLVVYFKNSNELVVTHLGIYQENGRVLSKKAGSDLPDVYEHDIHLVTEISGAFVQFYRKRKFKELCRHMNVNWGRAADYLNRVQTGSFIGYRTKKIRGVSCEDTR